MSNIRSLPPTTGPYLCERQRRDAEGDGLLTELDGQGLVVQLGLGRGLGQPALRRVGDGRALPPLRGQARVLLSSPGTSVSVVTYALAGHSTEGRAALALAGCLYVKAYERSSA